MEYELLTLINSLGIATVVLIILYHCFGIPIICLTHRAQRRWWDDEGRLKLKKIHSTIMIKKNLIV